MAYHLKHVGEEIDNLLDKADTALQEHQDISYLATKDELSSGLGEDRSKIKELGDALETEVNRAVNAEKELSDKIDKKVSDLIDSAPETLDTLRELADALQDSDSAFNKALANKVDKVSGKGLSTNDYTSAEKNKLASLQNYDDAQVKKLISQKQDIITDLASIREGAAKGATALQSHQDISGKQDKLVSGQNIKTINGQSILGDGDITIEVGKDIDLTDYAKKEDIPTIPTKVSFFDNDKGYITIDDVTPYDDTEIKNQIASKVDANYVNSAINSAITNVLNTEV